MEEAEFSDMPPLEHEALGWIIRLTSGAATRSDARAFEAWRDQRPEHAAAFRDVAALRKRLRAMPLSIGSQAADKVVPFDRPPVMSRRAMLIGSGGAIAASVAMLAINPPLNLWPSLAEMNAGERTGVGQRKTLRPMAGVTVEMNARSAVSLSDGGSAAELVAGEAFVSVASQARPMLIRAGGERWTVQNADINVRTSDRETCVTCVRGHAQRSDGAFTLTAGQRYSAAADAQPVVTPFDPELSGNWRNGILLFRNTRLTEAVEDINRYRSGKIILANRAIGDRLISGMFHTDQIDNAATQVQQLLNLKMTSLPGGIILFS